MWLCPRSSASAKRRQRSVRKGAAKHVGLYAHRFPRERFLLVVHHGPDFLWNIRKQCKLVRTTMLAALFAHPERSLSTFVNGIEELLVHDHGKGTLDEIVQAARSDPVCARVLVLVALSIEPSIQLYARQNVPAEQFRAFRATLHERVWALLSTSTDLQQFNRGVRDEWWAS